MAHGNSSTNWDDWDGMTPELVRNAVAVVEWSRRANDAMSHGQSAPPAPRPGGNFSSAMQLTSQQPGGPLVNVLTRDQSVTWFFKTREGRLGVMQLVSFTDDPPMAKIRYKLLEKTNSTGEGITTPIEADRPPVDDLADRYQACMMMTDFTAKNNALSSLAKKAAEAGNAKSNWRLTSADYRLHAQEPVRPGSRPLARETRNEKRGPGDHAANR